MVQVIIIVMLPLFNYEWYVEREILSFVLLDLTRDRYSNTGLRMLHLGDYPRPG